MKEVEKTIVKLSDGHVHFTEIEKKGVNLENLFLELERENFSYFLDIGITLSDFQERKAKLKDFKNVFLTVGTHPDSVGEFDAKLLEEILANEKVIAVGEIGLDYFREKENKALQIEVFKEQLKLAFKYSKPVVIHVRDAYEDVLRSLKELKLSLKGVIHCYSGTLEDAQAFIELGFKISFAGNLTFKNAKALQEVAKNLDLKHVLIETDSPYLAPVPFRGRVNTPLYVRNTFEFLCSLKGLNEQLVALELEKNLEEVFRFKDY